MKKSGQWRTTPDRIDRPFDHPRNRAPKITEEFQERIFFLFLNLVRSILGQPFLRLGLTETIWRRPQLFLQFRHGKIFQIFLLTSGLSVFGLTTTILPVLYDSAIFRRCLTAAVADREAAATSHRS